MHNNFSEKLNLSLVQQDVFYDQLHHIDSPKYNIGGYIDLRNVNEDLIKEAHSTFISNNRMFRLHLVAESDGVSVALNSHIETSLATIDFSTEQSPRNDALEWIDELFSQPFNIKDKVLFKAFLLKISEGEYLYVGMAHHLIIDGWGFANWVKQLGDYYSGLDTQVESEKDFVSYFSHSDEYLQSNRYRKDQGFWKSYLQDKRVKSLVPSSSTTASIGKACSRRLNFDLNMECYRRLLDSSILFQKNIHSLFLSLVAAYFCRTLQREKITIGVPAHNRRGPGQKRFIGLYTSMSPVNITVEESWSFPKLVETVKAEQARVFRHQKYPIGHMVRDLGPKSRIGLFDIGVNYLKFNNRLSFGETFSTCQYVENNYQTTPFNLTVWENGDSKPVQLQIDFSLHYFNEQEIKLIGSRLKNLLEQVANNPEISISELDVLSPDEAESVWLSPTSYPGIDHSVPFIYTFERQAALHPNRLALSWKNLRFNYEELNVLAASLAERLVKRGVRDGQLVGLLLDRTPAVIVSILALSKLGASYLPLDAAYPEARLRFMLEDSKCNLLLTTGGHAHLAKGIKLELFEFPYDLKHLITASEELPLESKQARPEHAAYTIYTSGSTGNPKGVVVSQRALSNFLQSMAVVPGFKSMDCLLAVTPFSFDISALEILLPLITGGSLRLFHTSLTNDIPGFIEDLNKHSVTVLQMTPSAWKILLAAGWQGNKELVALTGGEALPKHLAEELGTKVKKLWNMYGPTETTIWSSCSTVRLPMEFNSIGRPIANTKMVILDSKSRTLPVGVFGMLHIGGDGLAEGYLHRPDLTEERFVYVNGERWYKTGDIARLMPNGEFEFQGRDDHQVKINGYRIELEEIEALLMRQDGIVNCTVLIKTLPSDRKVICAYYQAGSHINQQDLKEGLATHLPAFMQPSIFIELSEFPLTPSGKTDLNALPNPVSEARDETAFNTGQYDGFTEAVIDILKSHLQISSVGPSDNFFDLGGNSQDILEITSRINTELNLQLSVIDLFASPSVKSLVAHINGSNSDSVAQQRDKRRQATATGKSRLNKRLNARKQLNEI